MRKNLKEKSLRKNKKFEEKTFASNKKISLGKKFVKRNVQ